MAFEGLTLDAVLAQVAAGAHGLAAVGCAATAATGAALAESACRVSSGRWAEAEEAAGRLAALREELVDLAEGDPSPLPIAEAAAEVAELAALTALHGKRLVRSDALTGSLLAESAARAAANLLAVDVDDRTAQGVARARWACERAEAAAERAWRAARELS